MDWQGLLHNKWVWAGGAVAGGAGLIVLLRKRAQGGTGGTPSAAGGTQYTPAYSSGSVGGFDSTGTDVASWLGNYSAGLDNQLAAYSQQLTDALAGIGTIPSGTTGTGAGPGATSASIAAGTNEYDWADQNLKGYKTAGEALVALRNLNGGQAGLDSLLGTSWTGSGGTKQPVTTKAATVRLA